MIALCIWFARCNANGCILLGVYNYEPHRENCRALLGKAIYHTGKRRQKNNSESDITMI